MPDYSAHYGMTMLGPGESLSEDDYAFTQRNISNLDNKSYLGAEGHHHDGAEPAIVDPDTGPTLELVSGSGGIPGGRTVRYKYTWVDATGQETAASPESTLTTPSPVAAPGRPSIARTNTGTLLPGNYFYVLTAYKTANTLETTPGPRVYTTLRLNTDSSIVLTLPSLPSGATGFNVYRRSPGSMRFQYIDTIDMSVATPPSEWDDDGTLTEDCNRTVPTRNTTNTSNSITISIPGATPAVPEGYTWKIYRTYTSGEWDSSLLHWAVEETSEGSGIVSPEYTDTGISNSLGTYPRQSEIVGSPDKVNLTDVAEVQGYLPVGRNIVPVTLNFSYAGTLTAQTGTFQWVCEYDRAQIIQCRAYLGVDSTPSSQDVIVDINKYDAQAATPGWASIFNDQADRPTVPVGESYGAKYTLVTADTQMLYEGDALSVDIDQEGGGATPTDYNLVVNVLLYVQDGSLTTSHTWAAS